MTQQQPVAVAVAVRMPEDAVPPPPPPPAATAARLPAQAPTPALWRSLARLVGPEGGLLVRAAGGRWRCARLPPARGGGAYLEVLPRGEVRLWSNDGQGHYRVLTPVPQQPARASARTVRVYERGRSSLVRLEHDD